MQARFVVSPLSGQYQLDSDIVTINVQPLPTPIPESFTGAIGTYSMNIVTPNAISSANTIQLKINITGRGNTAAITPPIIQDTPEYRVLSAPASDNIDQQRNQQSFDYVIIPKVSGLLSIPSIKFSYFDKSSMSYLTLSTPTFSIDVPMDALEVQVENQEVEKDIQFLVDNDIINKVQSWLNQSVILAIVYIANALVLIGGVMVFIVKKIKPKKPSHQKQVKKLLQQIKMIDKNTSIIEMEQILIKGLNYFIKYPEQSLQPKEVESSLVKAELSDPVVKSTMQWIKNAQILRYAKDKDIDQNHSNSESLKRILKEIYKESMIK